MTAGRGALFVAGASGAEGEAVVQQGCQKCRCGRAKEVQVQVQVQAQMWRLCKSNERRASKSADAARKSRYTRPEHSKIGNPENRERMNGAPRVENWISNFF
jgi:hypothetical protein